MPSAPDLAYAIGLPPVDAIEYFKGRGYRLSANALDAWDAARERAFTVTGIAKLDVLQDIKGELQRSLDDGKTYASFKAGLEDTLRTRGWHRLGRGLHADADTGEVAANLPGYRLKNIFRTNMQSALMAGKYRQLSQQVDIAPFWQYVAVMDSKTRPGHAAMHGKVFRYDDPVWNSHFPPCDYQCRCGVRALSQAMVDARELDVLDGEQYLSDAEQLVGNETRPAKVFTDPTTKARFVPGPGFGRRPDLASWGRDGLAQVLGDKVEHASPDLAAGLMASNTRLQTPLAAEYRRWAQGVLDAGQARNTYRVLGTASPAVIEAVAQRGVDMVSAALAMRDTELLHLARQTKSKRGAALSLEDILNLPALLANARAVLWDADDPALVYVLRLAGRDAKKAVVRVNWTTRVNTEAGREAITANAIRTAGRVQVGDLKAKRYEVIEGGLVEE